MEVSCEQDFEKGAAGTAGGEGDNKGADTFSSHHVKLLPTPYLPKFSDP